MIRSAAKNNENYLVNKWFLTVYESEFCRETWQTITSDWTYEEFLEMSNNVMYFSELKQATEIDHNREAEIARNRQQLMNK